MIILETSDVTKTGYTGAIAIEAMCFGYEDLSFEAFLYKKFNAAKKLERLYKLSIKV
ncbi:MAG: hypothetical protein FWD82_02880 [Defluviitaleaceae bacterium]|nr:hypothetical protein [Defluviitaleaceae bacterium]